MRDAFGKLMAVGDEALYFYISCQTAEVRRVMITGFTNKMVRWQGVGERGWPRDGTTMPHKLVLQPPSADAFGADRREEDFGA